MSGDAHFSSSEQTQHPPSPRVSLPKQTSSDRSPAFSPWIFLEKRKQTPYTFFPLCVFETRRRLFGSAPFSSWSFFFSPTDSAGTSLAFLIGSYCSLTFPGPSPEFPPFTKIGTCPRRPPFELPGCFPFPCVFLNENRFVWGFGLR